MESARRRTGKALLARRPALAEAVVEAHFSRRPELAERYGAAGREKCLQDAGYHLAYLTNALMTDSPALFADYVGWAKVMLESRRIPAADLAANLECLQAALREALPDDLFDEADAFVQEGLRRLRQDPAASASFLREGPHAALAAQYLQFLLHGRRHEARALVLDAVARGAAVRDLYLEVFEPTQHEIGRLWQLNRVTVAQEHFATAVTQHIMTELYPYIFGSERKGGSLLVACIGGELHEIGARMVADLFEMEGWDTFYLGANTPTGGILETVAARRPDVLGLSATITSHVHLVQDLIHALRSDEDARGVRVLVGGYPFNVDPDLWRRVGADGYALSAGTAVRQAEQLLASPPP